MTKWVTSWIAEVAKIRRAEDEGNIPFNEQDRLILLAAIAERLEDIAESLSELIAVQPSMLLK